MANEEWLTTGNCKVCRRKKYCYDVGHKPCGASKRKVTLRAHEIFQEMLAQGEDNYLRTHGGIKK